MVETVLRRSTGCSIIAGMGMQARACACTPRVALACLLLNRGGLYMAQAVQARATQCTLHCMLTRTSVEAATIGLRDSQRNDMTLHSGQCCHASTGLQSGAWLRFVTRSAGRNCSASRAWPTLPQGG